MSPARVLSTLAESRGLFHAYVLSGNDFSAKETAVQETLKGMGWNVGKRALARVRHPDFVFLEPRRSGLPEEITIAQIRRLAEFMGMSSWSSPYKVAVIEHADSMNREAQSAFLKLLEEPKGNTVFFLLAEFPGMLFETVRSRVQELKFYAFESAFPSSQARTDFAQLQKATLHERFRYAKELADAPEQIPLVLGDWLAIARASLHEAVREDSAKIGQRLLLLKTMQEVLFLLRTSNASPRLSLERLMLEL